MVAMALATLPLLAQQPCAKFSVAVGTDEDKLMLAINGADTPKEQLDALDSFAKAHADSKFMPCVYEYYTTVNYKLKDYDKSIENGEKDLAANYQDLNLLLTLMRAYAASTKVSDSVFEAINKVPDQVKEELGNLARPPKATDDEWAKFQKENAELVKDCHDVAVWAFFQLQPRVTDPAKTIQVLDTFGKAYPEQEKENAAQLNYAYFQAYQMQGKADKIAEYGDKVLAADPNNVVVGTTMALIYAFYLPNPSIDKAADYAQKALAAAQNLKKPDGIDDATFKKQQDNQLGIAHLVLGYSALMKAQKGTKFAPIVDELKNAGDLLDGNPGLQGQALYYLAFAYEKQFPANHHGAMDALNKAVTLPGPFQGQAQALLAKVKTVAQ
jgi:tetratricopeptide (TPR) repeat protein